MNENLFPALVSVSLSLPVPLSPTLPHSHLGDLWPFRQQGRLLWGTWLTRTLCVCVCWRCRWEVCVLVQWRVATRIQSNTNSLHAPGFLGRVCVCVRVCVCSQQSIEERWSAKSLGMPHKNLPLSFFFFCWPSLFSLFCYTFPVLNIFLTHSCTD